MFAEIILLVGITFAAGIVGGLVMAEAFEMEPREKRRRDRRARRQARKNVNFHIDKF
jgi:hypothetical protein